MQPKSKMQLKEKYDDKYSVLVCLVLLFYSKMLISNCIVLKNVHTTSWKKGIESHRLISINNLVLDLSHLFKISKDLPRGGDGHRYSAEMHFFLHNLSYLSLKIDLQTFVNVG